ncbi:histidine kinase [Pedobacter sp. ISL-68]|uniref:sensor histidine kinase n=1 Tax=unclassified Pedobacter TaxID=2628915 RepID=UPI001BE6B010|nr:MULTISPECIES: histidine kinase [unclassified Pedobacter]MBT2559779.1 histidine kinase [Pedobacter sp. ISL-64]MBT2592084.1 histidine kinase [Pedobacter sp. ISL-68]
MKKKYRIILFHAIFWLGYMLISTSIEFVVNPKDYFFSIGDFFFTQFPNICTFYLCIYIYTKYVNPLKIYLLTIGIVSVYLFSYLNWYITAYHIRPLIKANGGPTPAFHMWTFAVPVLWLYIKYSFFAFGYYYSTENIKYQKALRTVEKEKHHAQYAFLRAQINPHFLNNTLNFFYAKSLPLSAELADGIMTLSEIMHYSLKQDREDQTTLLDEEIAHIKNVITINQLRFNHQLHIDFEVSGPTANVRIIPLILITIVENILKHGSCTDESNPVKIGLTINEDKHYIQLKTFNKKKKGPKELSSGIGMENIRQRLSHHYGKGFNLSILDTETDYQLEMTLYPLTIRTTIAI